MDNARLAIMF